MFDKPTVVACTARINAGLMGRNYFNSEHHYIKAISKLHAFPGRERWGLVEGLLDLSGKTSKSENTAGRVNIGLKVDVGDALFINKSANDVQLWHRNYFSKTNSAYMPPILLCTEVSCLRGISRCIAVRFSWIMTNRNVPMAAGRASHF
jgi:hypothetical protein